MPFHGGQFPHKQLFNRTVSFMFPVIIYYKQNGPACQLWSYIVYNLDTKFYAVSAAGFYERDEKRI